MNDLDFSFGIGLDEAGATQLEIAWSDPQVLCDCCGDPLEQVLAVKGTAMLDLYLVLKSHYE